jgi:hypothetical protein
LEPLFEIVIKLDFFPELDKFNSGFDHIHEQTNCVSGYSKKRNKVDP